jgi:hypothetical protein
MDKQSGSHSRFDRLSSKLAQLESLLTMVGGEGVGHFRQQEAELQAYFLGLCARMAGECRDLCESLHLADLEGEAESCQRPMLLN